MYPDQHSASQKMYDRALASLPGGNTRTTVFMKPYPIYAARGEGSGIVIAGNDMGTENQSFLYCAAYGNGNFIVRGMGPAPFQMNGPRGGAHPAVNKAEAKGKPVTQEIALIVKGDKVSCNINGQEVASYSKAELVAAGKLKSTDGMVGFRMAHNTDAHIAGFALTKAP